MEHQRAGSEEAPAGRGSVSPVEEKICAGGTGAFRPGEMVSGRAAAALVAELFLAQGRRAPVGQPRVGRGRAGGARGNREKGPAVSGARRRAAGTGNVVRLSGVRRRILLPV